MTLDFQGPNKTIQQCIDFLKEEYGLACGMIIEGTKPLYADYIPAHSERLNQTIESLYLKNAELTEFYEGKKYLILSLACQIAETLDEATTPVLRYIL